VTPGLQRSDVRRATDALVAEDATTVEVQIELSEIPAPPFGETARAARVSELMHDAGLREIRTDEVGNVLGSLRGSEDLPPFVISAHLDTIFPAGTDVSVQREGDILRGPGISDDARGLATLLSLARVVHREAIPTRRPIIFAATVGEEGIGDLRGVKHLFGASGACREAEGFVSLDGAGLDRIVVDGLGSKRYRITLSGPGGHSWVDWGSPNPVHALFELGRRLNRLELSHAPKGTLTVARIGGGKSINAIPQEAWLEIDTRCADESPLTDLERQIRAEVDRAVAESEGLDGTVQVVGARPAGATDRESPLVRAAVEATRAVGRRPVLALSSTDANVPMSLGIPAVAIGCGGLAGLAHTTDEWYRNVGGSDGVVRALYTMLLAAGIPED
jgi:acetylornithine deacetylase/succinyl-diaminopimelate desuccinylase-like protein